MKVRNANKNDIPKIVNIHMDRFASFFLTSLGTSFLKVFYKAFLLKPGVLLVLEDQNEIKGFAAGSVSNERFFKKLLFNNLIEFIWVGFIILFTNPSALKRIASNANKSEKNNLIFAELLSIATVKNKQGYGKVLLSEFEKKVNEFNNSSLPISLTTDLEENDKAVNFYKDSGYEVYEIFESYQKRKMIRFLKNNN